MNPSADTIVAVATPPGEGGIGVVRLSGPEAAEILAALFRPERTADGFESHRLYHGTLVDPKSGEGIDEVLVVRMQTPRSYTGEDVAEIHSHGSPVVLARVVELACAQGARRARAGEFTERAFLNGKIDLAQAEAVADLIAAKTDSARRQALETLGGRLSNRVRTLAERLRRALAHVEVNVDFTEEDIENPDLSAIATEVSGVRGELESLLASYRKGRLLRDGARVALVGAPNAGKSSLFNALLEEERALVFDEPGTTRDRLEEWCQIEGLPVRLIDTAGLREAAGVEGAGVELARRTIAEADLLLLISDGTVPLPEESRAVLDSGDARVLWVTNKVDLPGVVVDERALGVSAKTGAGVPELGRAIIERLSDGGSAGEEAGATLTRERHREATARAVERLRRAEDLLLAQSDAPELASVELRGALGELAEIAGETATEELLGLIFGEFCIGK